MAGNVKTQLVFIQTANLDGLTLAMCQQPEEKPLHFILWAIHTMQKLDPSSGSWIQKLQLLYSHQSPWIINDVLSVYFRFHPV